jgi:hypothetical protein
MSLTSNETAIYNLNAFKDLLLTQLENSTLAEQIPDGAHIIILLLDSALDVPTS